MQHMSEQELQQFLEETMQEMEDRATFMAWRRKAFPLPVLCTTLEIVEVCAYCLRPVLLIKPMEGLDNTAEVESSEVAAIRNIARRLRATFLFVLYELDESGEKPTRFKVKVLHPRESKWLDFERDEYLEWLQTLREKHKQNCPEL